MCEILTACAKRFIFSRFLELEQLIAFKASKSSMCNVTRGGERLKESYLRFHAGEEMQGKSKINLISLKDEFPSLVDALLKINVC